MDPVGPSLREAKLSEHVKYYGVFDRIKRLFKIEFEDFSSGMVTFPPKLSFSQNKQKISIAYQ